MNNFEFQSPTYFAFGKNSAKKTGELAKKSGGLYSET
jgi:alcohol dehydrogenase YqhD (iron-dependent ADH family)